MGNLNIDQKERQPRKGMALCVLAFFLGAPFLSDDLLYLSFQWDQNVPAILLGEHRNAT